MDTDATSRLAHTISPACLAKGNSVELHFPQVNRNQLLQETNWRLGGWQQDGNHRQGCAECLLIKSPCNLPSLRKTILKMAQALSVQPTELWPNLEVAAILDSVNDFFIERELTDEQAKAIEAASTRPAANVKTRTLPSRKGK